MLILLEVTGNARSHIPGDHSEYECRNRPTPYLPPVGGTGLIKWQAGATFLKFGMWRTAMPIRQMGSVIRPPSGNPNNGSFGGYQPPWSRFRMGFAKSTESAFLKQEAHSRAPCVLVKILLTKFGVHHSTLGGLDAIYSG